MNLAVTHGAGLILRGLIVSGPDWTHSREGMALQTEHVHQAHFEEPSIGGTVGRMASAAALGLHRDVLVNEGPLLVHMALVADGIPARQGSQLPHGRRAMRVMAVNALHQTLVDAVVIGFGEIRLGRGMASVAQLGLALDQQALLFLGVMGGVAIETADLATGMGGFGKMRLLVTFAVAFQTAIAGLLP